MSIKIENTTKLKKLINNKDWEISFKALVLTLSDQFNNVKKVSELISFPPTTIYDWIKNWNINGIKGLKSRRGKGGGRRSYLSKNEITELQNELKMKKAWSTEELKALIIKRFSVKYSEQHVRRILKKYGK